MLGGSRFQTEKVIQFRKERGEALSCFGNLPKQLEVEINIIAVLALLDKVAKNTALHR